MENKIEKVEKKCSVSQNVLFIFVVIFVIISAFNLWTNLKSGKANSNLSSSQEVAQTIIIDKSFNDDIKKFISQNNDNPYNNEFYKFIESQVEHFIRKNPKIIISSLQDFQNQQMIQAQQEAQENIKLYKDEIENDSDTPVYGNKNGDIIITKFFDYNCGYCKRSHNELKKLMSEDKNIKLVLKDVPILGESSVILSKYALAVHVIDPSKYYKFYSKLMESSGSINENTLLQMINELGISKSKIENAMKSDKVQEIISKNTNLFTKLQLGGTPAFVINGNIFPGMLSYERLKEEIKNIRN